MPGQRGEFTTGNLAFYIGPMFDIGKTSNLSFGVAENYVFSPELKTATGTKEVSSETTNYSSLYFDFRHQISNKISLGTRYEWGLNSMFKSIDRKVSTISFTAIIQFGKKVINKRGIKFPAILHQVQPFNFLIVTYSIIAL